MLRFADDDVIGFYYSMPRRTSVHSRPRGTVIGGDAFVAHFDAFVGLVPVAVAAGGGTADFDCSRDSSDCDCNG